MKKTLVLLCLLFAGLIFCSPKAQAAYIFEQPTIAGYWFDDMYGYAYFCTTESDCQKVSQYNISPGILTNFSGSHAFTTTSEQVIKSVTLSLAKYPAMSDPGRLIMWCDGVDNYFYYSTQSLKASDLETDNFKHFQFDFPYSPCKTTRGFYFEMGGGFYNMKVQAVKADNKLFYGIGDIQSAGAPGGLGNQTGFESYEPYIQITEGDYTPLILTPPCDMGYSNNYPGVPLPTYDYDPADGLVRFHFKTNGSKFTYRRFNGVCESQYPVLWSQKGDLFNYTPATNNIMYKAKEVKDDSGNFLNYTWQAFNEDTGQELPINLSPANLAFGDPVISIGYFSYTGYPGYSTYVEYSIFSPAVWVKDPNFVAPPPTPTKTPVLIIPGIMGTEIFKGGEQLWAYVGKMLLPPPFNDNFMDPLSMNIDGSPLDTSLIIGNVIDKKPKFDYTQALIDDFVTKHGYQLNSNLLLFAYDWRRDNRDIALTYDPEFKNPSLKQAIDKIVLDTGSNKIDIIAHSLGGLVVKKLLAENPEYQAKINKLVFVGVPNLGAPKATKTLLYGDSMDVSFLGLGLDPQEVKKISQNMTSIYQLMPSREYFEKHGQYVSEQQLSLSSLGEKVPEYFQSYDYNQTKQVLGTKGLNTNLLNKADSFHTTTFDNFDFSGSGIDTYNIVGCQTGTYDKIMIPLNRDPFIITTAGDGTVPVDSAKNILGAKTFYAFDSSHGTMLTQDGIRQQIENIITGSSLDVNEKITLLPKQCHYKSIIVSVHSPVDLNIYDENGNHLGPNSLGNIDTDIEAAQYDVIGHSKYAYLPAGHNYTVKLNATGSGSFDLYASIISDGLATNTAYYNSIPITSTSTAEIILNSQNNQTITFTSDSRVIPPSSILDQNQSQDLIPPTSTSTILGLMGQLGFYRSNATITLSALDPIVDGKAEETSGVLKIQYSIDGGEYLIYSTSSPIVITSEGPHSFKFYSTDRAGNNETEQEVSFVIDKTPPELSFSFNPQIKDLEFFATDTLATIITSSSTSSKFKWPKIPALNFKDSDNVITATDAAGNTIQLEFKDRNRKQGMKAENKSIKYNGQVVNISNNKLAFIWLYDKKGNLSYLFQNAQSKVGFNILAVYNGSKTTLLGRDGKGVINKTLTGLNTLMLSTVKGDLSWSIKSVALPPPIVRGK